MTNDTFEVANETHIRLCSTGSDLLLELIGMHRQSAIQHKTITTRNSTEKQNISIENNQRTLQRYKTHT